MAELRATPAPQRAQRAPVLDRSAAQRQDWGFTAAAPNPELVGLVKGLSELNPALNAYTHQAIDKKQREDDEAAITAARADAAKVDMLREDINEVAGRPAPSIVPPAYGERYKSVFKKLLADRAGIDVKTSMMKEYSQLKDREDFNPETWLADARTKALQGFADPLMQGQIGTHLNEVEAALKGDIERTRLSRQQETAAATFTKFANDAIRGDMTGEQIRDVFVTQLQKTADDLGMSKKDATKHLFSNLVMLSEKQGGKPELFDAFEGLDETGTFTLMERNPELAGAIRQAKAHAVAQRDKAIEQASQKTNLKTMMDLEGQMKKDPSSITYDLLVQHIGPHAPFPSMEAALSFWHKAQKAGDDMLAAANIAKLGDDGMLNYLKPEDQKTELTRRFGGTVMEIQQAAAAGDHRAVATLVQSIMVGQSRTGSTVPVAELERFIQSAVTTLPNPEGPNAKFLAAAEAYKALSADPKYRDLYFKDDMGQLMRAYTEAVADESDTKVAYSTAYQSISAEAKDRAAQVVKTPEFQKTLAKAVNYVQGSSMNIWRLFGGNGRPQNDSTVRAAAAGAVRDYMQRNPGAKDGDIDDFVQGWASRNFVIDSTTRTAVQVPPALAGPLMQEALSEYSEKLTEKFRLDPRNDGEWTVQYLPEGTEGGVQVVLSNGLGAFEPVARTTLQAIQDQHRASKLLTPEEGQVLTTIRKQVESGTVDPALLDANRELIAKAKRIDNSAPRGTFAKLEQMQLEAMQKRLKEAPAMSFGKADLSNLANVPTKMNTKVDNKLTAKLALQFAEAGSQMRAYGSPHQSLAASLITMGEAAMLSRYPDPAKDAGYNIAMGYNFKANAKHVRGDFKRAGVPEDKVDDVVNGKAQLTEQQVSKLTMVAMERYEEMVQKVAAKTPGLWARMSPAQKAVMIDVAWQTGNPEKFQKAWAALAKGDHAAFAEEVKVYYTDHKGVRKEDTRRGSLRAAMLEGNSKWNAVVSQYGSFPSNAMESLALNSN
jgi:hypothetical protein